MQLLPGMVSTTRMLITDSARARSLTRLMIWLPFHADCRLDLVTGDDGTRIGRDHFHLDAEVEQLFLDQARSEFERFGADHGDRFFRLVEQFQRRQQRIGQIFEERHLLLALDARRFLDFDLAGSMRRGS